MNARYFIDTNIFVYSFQSNDRAKQGKSQLIIQKALESNQGCISTQVIQEFINVATRKFLTSLKAKDLQLYMQKVLFPLCQVFPNFDLLEKALEIHNKFKFSYYDSLIITAALFSKVEYLLTENLSHSQKIEGLLIINPYMANGWLDE